MNRIGSGKARRLAFSILLIGTTAIVPGAAFAGGEALVHIEKPKAGGDGSDVVVRATGVGYEPSRYSGARARLMARRAAIVDGYRKLAGMRDKVASSLSGKTYYESVNAFIRGASVVETRYYYGGRVEVDIELPMDVNRFGGPHLSYESLGETLRKNGVTVVEVEPEKRRITREEWEELFEKSRRQSGETKESEPAEPETK